MARPASAPLMDTFAQSHAGSRNLPVPRTRAMPERQLPLRGMTSSKVRSKTLLSPSYAVNDAFKIKSRFVHDICVRLSVRIFQSLRSNTHDHVTSAVAARGSFSDTL